MMHSRLPSCLLLILCAASPAMADVIHLKDGTVLSGDVRTSGDSFIITRPDGSTRTIAREQVVSLTVAQPSTDASNTADRLQSLRRAVASLDDLGQIIARYEQFIQANPASPILPDAQADLQLWKQRQQQNLVRFGGQWVTPAQRTQLRSRSTELLGSAVAAVAANQPEAAERLAQQAMEIDPRSPAALYLQGLLLYGRGQLVPARRSFESVNALLPSHGATLNNIAVIEYQQNQFPAAMRHYEMALAAAPLNRLILDNLTEAIAALKPALQRNNVIRSAIRTYTDQDQKLQLDLARSGWYRWGSSWINQQQLDQIHEVQKQVQEKLDDLDQQYRDADARIGQLEQALDDNALAVRQIEAASIVRDSRGNLVQLSYPPAYYQLLRDAEELRARRDTAYRQREGLRREADRLQQQMPRPAYSGIQKLIGIDGMPAPDNVPATETAAAPLPDAGAAPVIDDAAPATAPTNPQLR